MKRILTSLSIALALLFSACVPAHGQGPGEYINVQTAYGTGTPNSILSDLGYTVTTAKAKFPSYYTYWNATLRKPDADFLKNTFYTCCSEEASRQWGACNIYAGGMPGGVGQNGTPIVVNQQLRWPIGEYVGAGLFIGARFSTILKPDHDRWNGDPKTRNVLASWSYGLNGIYAYHEAAYLDKIRFDGDMRSAYYNPAYESSGVVLYDAGEGSQVNRIKADNFNDHGIKIERGTPAQIQNASVFCNNRGGIGLAGTAMNTVEIGLVTGDDNYVLIEMYPSGGREAGGCITVGAAKLESATIGEGVLHPFHNYTGHPYAICRGQFDFTTGKLTYASGWVTSGQLFWVDDRLSDGSPQASRIECSGKGFGYAVLLVDSRRGWYFDAPPPYSGWHMVYTTSDGVLLLNGVKQTPKPYLLNGGPLGYCKPGQTFNFATATPALALTGPVTPPTSCNYTYSAWSAWSACAGGQQFRTRTVTSTAPTGCVGSPVLSEAQPCTSPPTPVTVIATLPASGTQPWTNTDPNFKQDVNWKGARKLEFTALKATSLASKSIVRNAAGDRVVIGPDGKIYVNIAGTERVAKDPQGNDYKLVVNVAQNVTVDLWAPVDFTRIGDSNFGSVANANAFVGSWGKLVVSK